MRGQAGLPWWVGILAAVLLGTPALVVASDNPEAAGDAEPNMAAMMEVWLAAGAPGPEHERLAQLEGEWDFQASHWMGPGEPQVTRGTSKMKMVLGGRFLFEEYESEWMGRPITGISYTGYDNMAGHYISHWFDSMSTSAFSGKGRYDPDNESYQYTSEYMDPTQPDTAIPVRYVFSIDGPGQATFRWFETHDGQERKTMEIVYTRKGR